MPADASSSITAVNLTSFAGIVNVNGFSFFCASVRFKPVVTHFTNFLPGSTVAVTVTRVPFAASAWSVTPPITSTLCSVGAGVGGVGGSGVGGVVITSHTGLIYKSPSTSAYAPSL